MYLIVTINYFFDLPVYRLTAGTYYAARSDYIDKVLFRPGSPDEQYLRGKDRNNPRDKDWFRDYLGKTYGGCWEFNEIIGYIRLHFLGSQVRGEYFSVNKKRIVRTRTKRFEFMTWKLAPEVEIEPPYGTAEILDAIYEYINDCRREVPKRYIDTSKFDTIAPFVDWEGLFRRKKQSCE